jgi:hypothetical protein
MTANNLIQSPPNMRYAPEGTISDRPRFPMPALGREQPVRLPKPMTTTSRAADESSHSAAYSLNVGNLRDTGHSAEAMPPAAMAEDATVDDPAMSTVLAARGSSLSVQIHRILDTRSAMRWEAGVMLRRRHRLART